MKTIKEIRADLRDIRYYFSRKKSFEKLSGLNIRCEIEEKIKYYNNLMVMANPNLIDLYVNFSRQKPQTNPIFRRTSRLIHCSFRGLYLYTNPRKRRDLNVIYA